MAIITGVPYIAAMKKGDGGNTWFDFISSGRIDGEAWRTYAPPNVSLANERENPNIPTTLDAGDE